MKLLGLALLLFCSAAAACDTLILSGYAYHADRAGDYNSTTWGAGCEWRHGSWLRSNVVLFRNSYRDPALLAGAAALPLRAGDWAFGAAAGLVYGYTYMPLLPAAGPMLAYDGRPGFDLVLLPRVETKGVILWLRAKVPLK